MHFRVYTANGSAFEAVGVETKDGNFVFTEPDQSKKQIDATEMKAILFNGYEDFIIQQFVEIGDLQLKLAKSDKELATLRNGREESSRPSS